MTASTSSLQAAIEIVEQLSDEDQAHLLDVIYRRLIDKRRDNLLREVKETREQYAAGQVRRGTIEDLLSELDS